MRKGTYLEIKKRSVKAKEAIEPTARIRRLFRGTVAHFLSDIYDSPEGIRRELHSVRTTLEDLKGEGVEQNKAERQ